MSLKKLQDFAEMVNIADALTEDQLKLIGSRALSGFEDDLAACKEWIDEAEKVTEIASLKSSPKSYPLPNSANIKFPIITKAAYEFGSRTYPEIVRDGKVVKGRVIGKDPFGEKDLQAQRVSDYMNYQLLFENDEWEQELDKSLILLSEIGFLCKKTYYDPVRQKIKSEMCNFKDLILHEDVSCIYDAPRISHVLHFKLNDLMEHARAGVFLEDAVMEVINQHKADQKIPNIDLVEQHTLLDLDEDDYEEPYIVTFFRETGKVVRVSARYSKESIKENKGKIVYIEADQFFTDYHFLPSPKGKFQSIGFGNLMLHMNETINTLLNQLTDAGSLANMQTGIINSKAKFLESGNMELVPGQFVKVKTDMKLDEAFTTVVYKEPSSVLYQLLGLMIDASKDLSSSTEVLSGSSSPENVKSGAMQALIEQGMKVFNSIQKRIYRSLCHEYKKIFKLNKKYLDPQVYVNVLDDELAIQQKDFDEATVNIIPVADPNLSSDVTRMAQAQFIGSLMSAPGVKAEEIVKYLIETSKIPHPERFIMSDEEKAKAAQTPNPDTIKIQAEIEKNAQDLNLRGRELDLAEKKFMLDALKTEAEIAEIKTNSLLNIAKAEAAEAGTQLQDYQTQLSIIQEGIKNLMNEKQMNQDMTMHQNEMSHKQAELQANQEAQNADQQAPDAGMASAPSDQSPPSGS